MSGGILNKLLILAVVLFSQSALALNFRNIRVDQYVPYHCRQTNTEFFNVSTLEYFTVSVIGSLSYGFTYEYPIERHNANILFKAFNQGYYTNPSFVNQVNSDPELIRDYSVLINQAPLRGFEFTSEGEVLEILVLTKIQSNLNSWRLGAFATGSIEYHGRSQAANHGEIDVLISDASSCKAIAYGEAKLGRKRNKKARDQVARFANNILAEGFDVKFIQPVIDYL